MRVVGIDPGTVSIDLCGLADGDVFLDETVPTALALAEPEAIMARLRAVEPLDLVAGPSGYGLPLTRGENLTAQDIRLALLAPPGESGGLSGLGILLRALAASALPVIFTPGAIHLSSVSEHRKINRVDLGTADKVCTVALAIVEQSARRSCALNQTSFILLELGGAFTAALAVAGGQIIDGMGGSSGPIGFRASGALDGDVAFLAGRITKSMVFDGGATAVGGDSEMSPDAFAIPQTPRQEQAWRAFLEGAWKAVTALTVSVPRPAEIVVSGRLAHSAAVYSAVAAYLRGLAPVYRLEGFARVAKQAAQGAALIADGLVGGHHAELVEVLGLHNATGTALDHLYVVTPARARKRLGLAISG